jgi:hypothetical protein
MLITRRQKAIIEQYFINLPKRSAVGKNSLNSDYDIKMFNVIDKVIGYYESNAEKSAFIKKYIIGRKSWKEACYDLFIERRTYFEWKDEILSDAVICAIKSELMELDLDISL